MLEVIKDIERSERLRYIKLGYPHVCIYCAYDKKINTVNELLMLERFTLLLEYSIIFFNN